MNQNNKTPAQNPSWQDRQLGEIVSQLPQAAALFRSQDIDFCCGGQRLLGAALHAAGRPAAELDAALDDLYARAQTVAEQPVAYAAMERTDLMAHIEARHHTYVREALPRISELANRVLAAHGNKHPELFQVHAAFGRLRADLESHLIKEEIALFPLLAANDPARRQETARLAREIRAEHEAAGQLLHTLRAQTGGYVAPADGCATYHRYLEALSALEADLFEHIHLENNILLRSEEAIA